jgi:hypothetical protein
MGYPSGGLLYPRQIRTLRGPACMDSYASTRAIALVKLTSEHGMSEYAGANSHSLMRHRRP